MRIHEITEAGIRARVDNLADHKAMPLVPSGRVWLYPISVCMQCEREIEWTAISDGERMLNHGYPAGTVTPHGGFRCLKCS